MDRNDYYGGDSASLNLTQVGDFSRYMELKFMYLNCLYNPNFDIVSADCVMSFNRYLQLILQLTLMIYH